MMIRVLSIVLTTIFCAVIVWMWISVWMGLLPDRAFSLVGLVLGGVFGFWLAYTGRLARLFRRVDLP